ncbi:unnamed protein product [Phytophthora fragariaefolia]|uniref:Unnamed protein product n=1 Tax=Phytophthora fragariaefolia TaxID=1490495 RepID=A0A9W6XUF3_9STRA|nr:unnamed protein product [Phytophthora fragariaefolia]
MMNRVIRGLTWSTCLVYLDDIVVFTKGGMERHVVELASVLERLEAAGLTLKLRKCRFAMQSMEYLGHELSKDGVRPVQRLVTAAQFDDGTHHEVVTKERGVGMDDSAGKKHLRSLMEKPLLRYPNFSLPFRLATDASTIELGACLMQEYGQGWQPIAFASKVNNEAESKYSITELECLAVVWVLSCSALTSMGGPSRS